MVNELEKIKYGAARQKKKRKTTEKIHSVKDMQRVSVTEENVGDSVRGRQVIHCGDPYREQPKEMNIMNTHEYHINSRVQKNYKIGALSTGSICFLY